MTEPADGAGPSNPTCLSVAFVYYVDNTARRIPMRTIALLSAAALVTACHAAGNAEGTGPIVQRDFPVAGAFDKIALAGSPNVVVTVGAAASVRAEGDAEMLDRLEIVNENGQLRIGLGSNSGLVDLGR